jgi:CBS domain-containing protein
MRVAELMQKNLTTIQVDDRVSDAVSRIAEAHVSGLPVLDDRGTFVGVLSATDILVAESESDQPERVIAAEMVRDLMTPRPLTIGADEDVRTAARQMLYAEVHRLFVEEEGALVGVISQTDIVRAVANGRL